MANQSAGNPRAFFTFMKKGITDFHQTASIVPSQRFLVDAMVRASRPERANTIVELGPGVGPMTKPLLARMKPDARLFTIEIDEPLHNELVRRGSALGISLIPNEIRERILESAKRALKPGGIYVQFGYIHTRYITWTKESGLQGFNYMKTLKRHFGQVTRKPIPANFPPAWVYMAKV